MKWKWIVFISAILFSTASSYWCFIREKPIELTYKQRQAVFTIDDWLLMAAFLDARGVRLNDINTIDELASAEALVIKSHEVDADDMLDPWGEKWQIKNTTNNSRRLFRIESKSWPEYSAQLIFTDFRPPTYVPLFSFESSSRMHSFNSRRFHRNNQHLLDLLKDLHQSPRVAPPK